MSETLYLAEITAWDPNRAATRVLRYSNGRGYVTGPSADPANTYYAPRILQPVNVVRSMFSPGATMGRSETGYGDLVLLNGDGELDELLEMGIDGRQIRVLRTNVRNPSYPADFSVLLVGTMEQPEFRRNEITISLRDRQFDLDVPLQATKYAGDNVLPDGIEGVATDLQGRPKPVCFGVVKNVPAPCVNTARLIYQVNDGAVASIAAYDRGVALTAGTAHASQAALEAATVTAGTYDTWLAGGLFRLGSSPDGLITADVTQGASSAERTAARIYEALIARARLVNDWTPNIAQTNLVTDAGDEVVTDGGLNIISSGDVSQSDLSALDSADPSELGYWSAEEITIGDVCDQVANTVGAWWGVDREGVFRIGQLVAPASGEAVHTFVADDLVQPLERLATRDPGNGIPVYRQVIRWGRYHVTQTSDIAASVTDARRGQLANEWRQVISTDPDLQQAHLLSPEVIRDSLYTEAADALAEAARRLALYAPRRDLYALVVKLNEETQEIDLGDTINVDHARYGLRVLGSDAGVPFRVIGVEPDARNERLTLNVWGGSTGLENLITDEGLALVTDDGTYITTQAA